MSHPLERLAQLVDGSLEPLERSQVEAHLRSCDTCRGEVAAASAARAALGTLPPPEAPDLAASFSPADVARLTTEPAPASRRWSKAAPALAAAAVIALIAIVIPRLGTSSVDQATTADGLAEAGTDDGGGLRLQLDPTDFDEAALDRAAVAFAASVAADAPPEAGAPVEGAPEEDAVAPSGAVSASQARTAGPGRTARAVSCLTAAFPGFPGEIVEVRRASFRGTPAFLGVVLEGGAPSGPPEIVSIWVAGTEDCSILSFTSARVPS